MKEGDIVMFKPEGTYAKWFGGKLGTIVRITYNKTGKLYYRIHWLEPVLYHDDYTNFSSFSADKFELFDGDRK